MTKNQKVLELYLKYNSFTGRNAVKVAKDNGVDRKMFSYLRTLMAVCTPDQQEMVKKAIQLNEKIKFNNGEITGSLELCAALANKGYKVEGYGDTSMVVYLLECDGKTKIGIAKSISSRIASMQTGNPYEIILKAEYRVESEVKARELEKELHTKYSSKQLVGEWFNLDTDDIKEISDHIKESVWNK